MPAAGWMPSFLRTHARGQAAFVLAVACHRGQRREVDHAPFVLHPLKVAALLHMAGGGESTIAAGLLHDVLEKTAIAREALAARIGDDVATAVAAVTEDPTIADYAARKAELRVRVAAGCDDAVLVFAADKLAKSRELRHARRAAEQLQLLLEHYEHSLDMVAARLGDHVLVEQLRFELEALRAFPPAGAVPEAPGT